MNKIMMTKDFGMGFSGRNPFDMDARKKFKEEWLKMTDSEKIEFINKRMESIDKHEDHFSVEAIDARCEKWMAMTPDEKQMFIDERKKAMHDRVHSMHGFFGHMHR